MSTEKKPRIQLTALWKHETQDGKTFLSGYLGNATIQIWPNGYKKETKQPDFIVYLQEPEKKEEQKPKTTTDFPF